MRGLLIGGAVLLAACAAATEGATPESAREISAVSSPNKCDSLSGFEIIESIHAANNAPPNATWREVLSAPHDKFGPLAALIGRCYKGTPTGESVEQIADIQYWSTALGGAAITIEHALEDGSYGGISYVYPKARSDDFTYIYITNTGFHTQGTIILDSDGSFTASETVDGHPTITEVRSATQFDESGLTSMTSKFLDDGIWKPGPGFTHEVTTQAFPRLQTPKSGSAD